MKNGLNNTQIKLIAMFFMLLDHIGVSLVSEFMKFADGSAEGLTTYYVCRLFGRIAFPLFCFLIAEGVKHTHNLSKYTIRMLLFAVISEIPFDLMGRGIPVSFDTQNVFWTFVLFLTAVAVSQKQKRLLYPCILIAAVIAEWLHTDYGWIGIALLYCMLSGQKALQQIGGSILIVQSSILLFADLIIGMILAAWPCLCFIMILNTYNGMRGQCMNKYIFYGFYPVHMLLLWLGKLWI